MKVCKIPNCGFSKTTNRFTSGYCNAHYLRFKRGSDLSKPSHKEPRGYIEKNNHLLLPLGINGKNGYAIIDKSFKYLSNYNWSKTRQGYARGVVNGDIVFLHHCIIGKHTNIGMVIDHINRDKLDNRASNLRIVPQSENSYNKIYNYSNKTSLYRGVSKVKSCSSWRATIKGKHIGSFKTETEAAIAYNKMAIKEYSDYAILNEV